MFRDQLFLHISPSSKFSVIDALGAWDCALSRFTTVKDISRPLRSKWSHIYGKVLLYWERSVVNKNDEAVYRSLKILLFLPQLLLRQTGRGGKPGQGGPRLAARFDLALQGDWSTLVDQWKADLQRLDRKESSNSNGSAPTQSDEKLREQVLQKLSEGQLGELTLSALPISTKTLQEPHFKTSFPREFALSPLLFLAVNVFKVSGTSSNTQCFKSNRALLPAQVAGVMSSSYVSRMGGITSSYKGSLTSP